MQVIMVSSLMVMVRGGSVGDNDVVVDGDGTWWECR